MSSRLVLALIAIACVACNQTSAQSGAPRRPAADASAKTPVVTAEAKGVAGANEGTKGGRAAPWDVRTVAPEYKVRVSALETTGKVQFNEEAVARVNAPITGRVTEVLVKPGDVVQKGQQLVTLDSPDLGAAKSDYAKAVSDVTRADAALRLAKELFDVKAVAQKEIRDAENEYRKATAERERAAWRLRTLGIPEAALADIAKHEDASTTIVVRAPRAGVVVERNVTPGQVVAYGQSDTPVNLCVIADLGTMWVLADVYEPDILRVRLGQPVTVTLPCCPGERYEGHVSYISDSVDPQTRTVKVRAVVPNRGRVLKNEMFVKVSIAGPSTRVLTIPQSAVHREANETYVLVPRGKDEYERRPVKLGADLNGSVEVLAGLTPQDRVAAEGSILLRRSGK